MEVESKSIQHRNNKNFNLKKHKKHRRKSSLRKEKRTKRRWRRQQQNSDQTDDEVIGIHTKQNRQYHNESKTWGDEISLEESWPMNTQDNTIRIVHYNTNGIGSDNCYTEWESILHSMDNIQCDIFCLNETKLDTRQSEIQYNLKKILRNHDQYAKITMESSLQPPRIEGSKFKPGGTMIGTKGTWSGRCITIENDYTKDNIGRWCSIHLQGKRGQIITILSIYQVCKHEVGKNTAYIQQQADLIKQHTRILDPREQLCKDLQKVIEKLNQNQHKIIICADINDDAGIEFQNKWNDLLEITGMRNIHQSIHQNQVLPRTYDQGKRCLDMIATSSNIQDEMIKRAGFLPFYTLNASDHRPLYIDIDINQLFDEVIPDTTKTSYRRFNTKNIKKCNQYIQLLDQYFEESRMYKKMANIRKEINAYLKENTKEKKPNCTTEQEMTKKKITDTLETLDHKRWELMMAAEKRCGPGQMKGKRWSSTRLQKAAEQLSNAKKKLRECYSRDNIDQDELKTAIGGKNIAIQQLRETQKNDRKYRDEMLEDLAKKRAKAWKMKTEQAAKMLKQAEKSSDTYSKISATVKGNQKAGVRALLVPTSNNPSRTIDEANDDTNGNWKKVRDSEAIFETILIQNAKSLAKSREGLTATGPFSHDLGHDAENDTFISHILEGTINPKQYGKYYSSFQSEAEEFVKNMQTNKHCKEMVWDFGIKEYKELFSKTREETACGPSGLHMSHWRAALEHDSIMQVHSTFIWAAFKLGISYKRWQISWHCMIQKLNNPYSHKLRIIQLFEGDFNGGLKYILGRLFMRKITQEGAIEPHAYGSIPGKDAIEAMKLLQYLYDNHRILKKDLIVIFNDAAGCYDRVRPNHSELCSLRLGCPRSIMQTHTITQNRMQHHVKTATGISKGYIKWGDMEEHDEVIRSITGATTILIGNIGGIGQGGGASPVEWLAVLLVMIKTFKKFSTGAIVRDPLNINGIHIPIVSYVDDNSIVKSIQKATSVAKIFEEASQEMRHWKRILRVTGGDLAPQKCTVSLMKWKWNKNTGVATIMKKKEAPGTITITDRTEGIEQTVTLKRLEVNEGERQLGIIMPLDGSFHQEKERKINDCKSLGKRLYRAPLTHEESVIVYRTYYIPKISYSLSITKFTQKDCNKMQSHFYRYALPKMGLNRNTPKALLYGPMDLGGMELHDIYTDQLIQHTYKLQQHIRREDNVGKAFLSNLTAYETVIGSSKPLLQINPWRYNYDEQASTVYFLWRMTRHWKINLSIPHQHPTPQQYSRETNTIMDDAVYDSEYNQNPSSLKAINACRLYHGVVYPSDMISPDEKTIYPPYLFGNGSLRRQKHINWPTQPLPTDSQWRVWRSFVRKHYSKTSTIDPNTKLQQIAQDVTVIKCLNQEEKTVIDKAMEELPASYQHYLQFLEGVDDHLEYIIQAYLDNSLIVATDGSHIPETSDGAAAAVFARTDDINRIIICGNKCEVEEGMTSMTTEHYGVICALTFLQVLVSTIANSSKRTVSIWIDNAEVLKRAQEATVKDLTLKSYDKRDYAINQHMTAIIKKLMQHCKIYFLKIKGHQDQTDATFESQLNTKADEGANFMRNKIYGPQNKKNPLPEEGLWITDANGIQIHDYKSWIWKKIKGQDLIVYLCNKNSWTKETYHTIDWKGIASMLRKLKKSKQMSYLQLIHNWQHIGSQKQQFLKSKYNDNTPRDEDEMTLITKEIARAGQCPYQCGHVETYQHYMICTNAAARKHRHIAITKLKKTLNHHNYYGAIVSYMILGLTWDDHSQAPQYKINLNRIDPAIKAAVEEQTSIGWNNVKRGMISKKWAQAQRIHMEVTKSTATYAWGQLLITTLLTVSWELWTKRNVELHGSKGEKEQQAAIQEELYSKVDLLYAKAATPLKNNDQTIMNIFMINKRQLKKRTIAFMQVWIESAETVLQDYDKRRIGGIEKWLQKKSTRRKL